MKKILENTRYIVLLAVFSSIALSAALFVWNTIQAGITLYHMFSHIMEANAAAQTAHMVGILDSYLLAVILYIFGVALYELFIDDLDLPDWLNIKDLDDLKKKLSSVIALMLGVTFLEHVVQWDNALDTLYFAISIAVIIFALVFYMKTKGSEPSGKE